MKVHLGNIYDDDLNCIGPGFGRSLSLPPLMIYFLQRICRSVVVSVSPEVSDLEQIEYGDVIALDGDL